MKHQYCELHAGQRMTSAGCPICRDTELKQPHMTVTQKSVPEKDLLPCPFCGGKATYARIGTGTYSCIIECSHCGCMLETTETWASGQSWNTRHQEDLLREALQPFAKQADTHGEQIPDEMFIDDYVRDTTKPWKSMAGITVGELRRARTALKGTT